MRVALCVTCKNRTQHLERTLPLNLQHNRDAVTVLVNYNSQDHLEDYVRRNHESDIDTGRLAYYRFTEPTQFRMAHAKNLAHRLGMLEGADVLVNLDADNFTGDGFSSYVSDKFSSGERIFLWSRMVKQGDGRLPRGISGRIAVTREAFVTVGGYDEKFSTYSPDDKDFNLRLRHNGRTAVEIEPQFLSAILHTDKMRFKEYPEARETAGEYEFTLNANSVRTSVTNEGRFGTGVVYKNFSKQPTEVRELPARIFGIGMHKTGTTSFHQALRILGCNSAHWRSPQWAKQIWKEMRNHGMSRTLERHYALSDLPFALMYKQLDIAYPGSKFVLTVRNEEDWLQSARTHFSSANPAKPSWEYDAFTNEVHEALYGRRDFNAAVFLERYRRHNEEVKAYFKDRPHDLLVMDMSRNAGWYELCGFLRAPIPDEPYPRRNVTKN